MTLDVARVHRDFTNLTRTINGNSLVYLDTGATALKPRMVTDAVDNYYKHGTANIHRGVHTMSAEATASYECVRTKIVHFLGAARDRAVIFTSGTTAAINLVAQSYGRTFLKAGDEIIISEMEHHANIVPWQMLREQTGCKLVVVPIEEDGSLSVEAVEKAITSRSRLLSMVHVSNSLGTINPIKEIVRLAKSRGLVTVVDGAQAVSTQPVDIGDIGCDFYAFSGHKLFGPTGVGVLIGNCELLEKMPPVMGGGDMILSVTFEKTIYNEVPVKFEAGTPNIAGVIGLGAAIDYVNILGVVDVAAYEASLGAYAEKRLNEVEGLRIIGNAPERAAIYSFVIDGIHPHDIGTILDQEGVAIRTGHHCTQPVMARYGVPATARAGFSIYNTETDVDRLITAIMKAKEIFS